MGEWRKELGKTIKKQGENRESEKRRKNKRREEGENNEET